MRQQMSLRQDQRPEMAMLFAMFPEEEVKPRRDLRVSLDLKLDGGKIIPVVHLRLGDEPPFSIHFEAMSARAFWSSGASFRDFRRHARVEFLQEDPTTPDVFIFLSYRDWRWEHATTSVWLERYMNFLALDEEGGVPGPEEYGDFGGPDDSLVH